ESGLRANARDADEHLEERELVAGFKPIERLVVFADRVMRMQEHLVARRLSRYVDLVADPVRLDDHVIRAARDHRAAYGGDHCGPRCGRVEARGAHVLAGPFACALVRSAHSADGNSRRAVAPHSPSPPALSILSPRP